MEGREDSGTKGEKKGIGIKGWNCVRSESICK
jgi:hypothetical protein